MSDGKIKAIILSLVILVPLLLFFFARGCTTQVFKPVHKAFVINEKGDTNYLKLPENFTLYDAKQQAISAQSLKGKILLMLFFPPKADSSTLAISNVAFGNIQKDIFEIARDVPDFQIIAVSTSPIDANALAAYQQKWEAPIEEWAFVSASKEDVWKLGKIAFQLPEFVGQDTSAWGFPCQNMVFIDKNGYLRGFYDKHSNQYKNYYEATQLGINGTRTLIEDFRALLMQEYSDMNLKIKEN